jgi:hypothetical protein
LATSTRSSIVYEAEGFGGSTGPATRRFDDDFLSASDNDLKPYASAYFEYNSSHPGSEGLVQRQCGCSGAGNGTNLYTYDDFSATLYTSTTPRWSGARSSSGPMAAT